MRELVLSYTPIFSGELGLVQIECFLYLSGGGSHKVEGTNDAHEFNETLKGEFIQI